MVPSRLLVTDLDGTLVGDGEALRAFLAWWRKARSDVRLVYNTARTWPSAQGLLRSHGLPWPDAVVTGLGTEIRFRRGGPPDPAWAGRMAARWDRRAVMAIAASLGSRLVPQPSIAQGPHKASFEVADPADALRFLDRLLGARLWVHAGLTQERFVDVIPFLAGKGAATAHLRLRFGISAGRTMTIGDSENDLGMLSRPGPAIAVGNASPGLLGMLGSHVYRAPSAAAAGILEGLRHFGWR
ncbi:MAG: HAD hydrolase family protein [Candidatus Sericytochromatia bacterium]|nr:HAD hydrolase family protein [Candidatus Tanganyikabacteria bacterium]